MPKYFFDVHDGTYVRDTVGVELPDVEAAQNHAMQVAADHVRDPAMLGAKGGAMVIEVRDARNAPACTVHLAFDVQTH